MTRGKYTARAATARAEQSQTKADALREQLEQQRTGHARETSALKAEIQQLTGQLTTAVRAAAAAEVERVTDECATRIEAVRAEHRAGALKAAELLGPCVDAMEPETLVALANALGVPLGEFVAAAGTAPDLINRTVRRATSAKYARAASLSEQAGTQASVQNVAREAASQARAATPC